MFERLMIRGAAAAARRAVERRTRLAAALAEAAPDGMKVEEREGAVVISGRRLSERFALQPALRWLLEGLR